jgi:hypothetical protein
MKCRYRFPVHGRIRPSVNMPVPSRGWTVEFKTTGGLVTHIDVIVPLPRREDWPVIHKDPEPGIKAHVEPKTPHLPWIQRELRALQGLLALFGLRSIELDAPEITWLPESEEERSQLHLFSYKRETEPLPDDQVASLSFDLLARAVIAADAATDIEVPLNFFRRGMLDVYERNYIEAIYDFYFILETVFGEGKFRKAAVSNAFLSSDQLRSCVQRALSDPGPMITYDRRIRTQFEQSYGRMAVEEAVERIIELRGYLHHHTVKRRDIWHPEDQRRYEVDALFLQVVTYNVVFAIAERYLWDEGVVHAYEELAKRYRGQSDDAGSQGTP